MGRDRERGHRLRLPHGRVEAQRGRAADGADRSGAHRRVRPRAARLGDARRARLAVLHPGLRAGRPHGRLAGPRPCRAELADARHEPRSSTSCRTTPGSITTGFARNPEFYVQGTLDNYRAEPGLYHPIEDAGGDTVRFIACGRDPFFPPWRDVAQLNYFNPATRDAMIGVLGDHRAALRRRPLRHGDAGAERRLRADVAPSASICSGSAPAERVLARGDAPRADDLPRRGLLGPRVPAAAAGVRLHLRQAPARSAAPRRPGRRRAATCRPTRPTARSSRGSSRTTTRRAASREFGHRIRAAAALTFTLPGLRFFFDGQFEGAHAPRAGAARALAGRSRSPRHPRSLRAAAEGDRQAALPRRRVDAARRRAAPATRPTRDLLACAWRKRQGPRRRRRQRHRPRRAGTRGGRRPADG